MDNVILALVIVSIFALVALLGLIYQHFSVRKHMENERELRKMRETLLANAPFIISMWKPDGTPVDVGGRVVEILGLSEKVDYLEKFYDFTPELQPCGKPSKEAVQNAIAEAHEKGYVRFEFLHQTSKGEVIPMDVELFHFLYHEADRYIAYASDTRPLRALSEKEQLLAATKNESQAKSRFLARMSHEIRTPLASIMGITDIQLQTVKHAPIAEEAFLRIHNSSKILLTIINDILDLAKVEAGKMEITPEPYNVASMIFDTVQLNLMYIGSKGIEFKLNVDENIPSRLIGDELRIKQILNNLLSNAFKYTNAGHVSLSISAQSTETDMVYVLFRVEDTGIGMTPEQLEIITTEYQRADTKEIRFIEGTGLGMSIANYLINQMGGEFHAESEVGAGSCFTVLIPQKPENPEILGAEVVENLQKMRDKFSVEVFSAQKLDFEPMPYGKVLVVDDVESNRFVAKGLLAAYRLEIDSASSGRSAVDKVLSGKEYDIIFMDHMMPHMDGVEAARLIIESGYKHPIVALTANTIKGQAEEFLKLGFADFISKPIDVNALDACLMRFVRDKQPSEVVDRARAEKLASQGVSQDAGRFRDELERVFLRDAEYAIEILSAAEADRYKDIKTYTTYVHAIKSALANIGQHELSEDAYDLECAARNKDMKFVRTMTPTFVEKLRGITESLKSGEIPPKEIFDDPEFLRGRLEEISAACKAYDIKKINSTLKKLKEKPFPREIAEFIEKISIHALRGDYEDAANLIEGWQNNG